MPCHFDIRRDLYDNLLDASTRDFTSAFATGDLISRMYTDLDTIWRLLLLFFVNFGNAFFGIIVAFTLAGDDQRAADTGSLRCAGDFDIATGARGAGARADFEKISGTGRGRLSALVQDARSLASRRSRRLAASKGVNREVATRKIENTATGGCSSGGATNPSAWCRSMGSAN